MWRIGECCGKIDLLIKIYLKFLGLHHNQDILFYFMDHLVG